MRTQSYLVRDDTGNYQFAHKSFMEFFVAQRAAEEIRKGNSNIIRSGGFLSEVFSSSVDSFLKWFLLDYKDEVLSVLFHWLEHGTGLLRRTSALLLGMLGDRKTIRYLLRAIADERNHSYDNMYTILFALGELGGSEAEKSLVTVLKSKHAPAIRRQAAEALVKIGTPTAIESVRQAIRKHRSQDPGDELFRRIEGMIAESKHMKG